MQHATSLLCYQEDHAWGTDASPASLKFGLKSLIDFCGETRREFHFTSNKDQSSRGISPLRNLQYDHRILLLLLHYVAIISPAVAAVRSANSI